MMMLKKLAVWTLLLLPISLQAQTTVPQYLNFQSVVMDDGGNLVTDPFVNLNFKILDKDGSLVYEEDQKSVQVLKGAVNVMIGEGTIPGSSLASPTGGITMEALDPREGTHFLRVTIGNNQPLNDMELLSTPYAMYAEQALSIPNNTITSDHIIDGSIKLVDLEPGLAFSNLEGMASEDQVPASLATDAELQAHIDSGTAHAARNITVRGPFLASDAGNLEDVLRSLDRRVVNYYNNNQEFLDNETSLREVAITAEESARTIADTTLQSNIGTERDARILADSALQTNINNEATTRGNADSALQTLVNTAQSTADSKISKSGDTMTGDLKFEGGTSDDFEMTLTVVNPTADRTITLPDADDTITLLTATQTLANKTLTTPTIGNFTNATHNHQSATGGSSLDAAAIASGTLPVSRGGTGSTSFTAGSVVFAGPSGTSLTEDNSGLYFDRTLNRLGVGTSSPQAQIQAQSDTIQSIIRSRSTASYAALSLIPSSGNGASITANTDDSLDIRTASGGGIRILPSSNERTEFFSFRESIPATTTTTHFSYSLGNGEGILLKAHLVGQSAVETNRINYVDHYCLAYNDQGTISISAQSNTLDVGTTGNMTVTCDVSGSTLQIRVRNDLWPASMKLSSTIFITRTHS